jgi:hypothetical protein
MSTWVQSGELQSDERARLTKLQWNEKVLRGDIPPYSVPLRREYNGYYAVMREEQVPGLPGWASVRSVGGYTILRWLGHR